MGFALKVFVAPKIGLLPQKSFQNVILIQPSLPGARTGFLRL
jgi:hypothetical protein